MRTFTTALTFSLLLALLPACKESAPPKPSPAPQATATKTATPAAPKNTAPQPPAPPTRPAPPDHSFTVDKYIALGVPATDREWTGADVAAAAKALSTLAADQLPRLDSPSSGPLFARMINPQNLGLSRNTTLSLDTRLMNVMTHLQALNTLGKQYYNAFTKDQVRAREVTELFAANLDTLPIALDLLDETAKNFSNSDPSYSVRMQGLAKAKGGVAQMIAGCLMTLSERPTYSAEDLAPIVAHLKSALPGTLPHLSQQTTAEIKARLKSLLADPATSDMQASIKELQAVVDALP